MTTIDPKAAAGSLTELVDEIEATHHRYLHRELPRLVTMAGKMIAAHREHHPERVAVQTTLSELRADLEPHLATGRSPIPCE